MRQMLRWLLLPFSALLAWHTSAEAQVPVFQAQFYGIEEGLSHRNVQCIHQDKRGFIWLGTDYGLNRFDGYHFKWFTKEDDGMASSEVNYILEDKDGYLWLFDTGASTDQKVNALTIFDPVAYTFQTLEQAFGKNLPFVATDIIAFAQNEKGHLAFITKNQQLVTYTDHWNAVLVDFGQQSVQTQMVWAPNDELWVLLEENYKTHTLLVMDQNGQMLQRLPHPSRHAFYAPELSPKGDGAYVQLRHSQLGGKSIASFAQTDPKIGGYEAGTGLYGTLATPTYNALCRPKSLESPGHYWMVENAENLIVLNKISGEAIRISDQYPKLKNVNCLFLDDNQTVWIGTLFGVYHFQLEQSPFKLFLNHKGETNAGELSLCRQITTDDAGNLWVRMEKPPAIWKINLARNQAMEVDGKNRLMPPLPPADPQNKALLYTSSHFMVYPSEGNVVWADPVTHRFSLLDTRQSARIIWTLYEDRYGKIWFCDKLTSEIGYFTQNEVTILPQKASENGFLYVYQYLETADPDVVLLATNQGLLALNVRTCALPDHYWSKGAGKHYFPYDNLHHLHRDKDGTYWAATANDGMVHFADTPEGFKIIRRYTRTDGLSNNAVYAIYGDDYDNLWLATDYGINQFNKKTGQFRNYTEKDGLSSNEFNRGAHFQGHDGSLYFGGMNGITAFNPRDFVGDTLQLNAAMAITDFEQFDGQKNKLVNKLGEILLHNTIVMRPDDRFFLLEFALLNFEETNKSQFAYMVEGVDKEWTYQKENFIRLSRLPFGNHTLRIKGQNASGQWSNNELAIKVCVLKPFYLQTWFLIAVLSCLVAGVFGFYKWRVRSLQAQRDELERTVAQRTRQISEDKKTIEQQAEELKSLEKLKSRFFANVSHELRTPLTLILGPISAVLQDVSLGEKSIALLKSARRSGNQLLGLINEILDLSKLEAGSMSVLETPNNLHDLLHSLQIQFESHARFKGIDLLYQNLIAPETYLLLDKKKVTHIVNNLLSNAIKFTDKGGRVTLRCSRDGDQVRLSVIDNGRGIHSDDLPHIFERFYQGKQGSLAAEGGTGIGLSLSRELAELMGGSLQVESAQGKGSTFYCLLPYRATEKPVKLQALDVDEDREGSLLQLIATLPAPVAGQPLILVVEDNPGLQQFLTLILREKFAVESVGNGQEALDWLAERSAAMLPNLLLSDIMMPQMDGFQLLENLKNDDRYRHLPIIMLTARAELADKLHALRMGVDDYMLKPFEEEELMARVENLLRFAELRYKQFTGSVEKALPPALAPDGVSKVQNSPIQFLSEANSAWLKTLEEHTKANLENPYLDVEFLADLMNTSSRHLQRRLKTVSGLTINQYLQEARLQHSRHLLERRNMLVKQVAAVVGYKDIKHFTRLYKDRFGKPPSMES